MTSLARRPHLRWLVPLVAVVVLGTAGSVIAAISATARDSLPPRTASQLLVDVQKAQVSGFSGTIVQSADLGLPALPGPTGSQSSNFSSLVSGSHTLRVWYAGPDRVRLALLGQLGESDLVRTGSDLWIWSSHDNSARHFNVPQHDGKQASTSAMQDQSMTPVQAADAALKAITPTTRVSTESTAVVAGRSAYQLVLQPRDPGTLIGSVRIAIDGATHIPTRVQVFARGATQPAFEVGFTSFDPSTPSSSVFTFNPPPGATVSNGFGQSDSKMADHAGSTSKGTPPETIGKGWTTVVKAQLPTSADKASSPLGNLDALVKSLPTVSGAWGSGHLLQGTLFSVLVTDNGQVVAGAVPPSQLYAALASQ